VWGFTLLCRISETQARDRLFLANDFGGQFVRADGGNIRDLVVLVLSDRL
jgi:hypothetical protein